MLTTPVTHVAAGLTPVKSGGPYGHAQHRGAEEDRADRVGEVVVRELPCPSTPSTVATTAATTTHVVAPTISTARPNTITASVVCPLG